MRLFNQKVWNGTAVLTEVFTDADLNVLLGSADAWAIHAHITRATAASKLNVNVYHSGDNKNWKLFSTMQSAALNAQTVEDAVLVTETMGSTASRLGFVRLGILMNGTGQEADVELYVTGRSL